MRILIRSLVVCLLIGAAAAAQQSGPIPIAQGGERIRIDGVLDETAWQSAPEIPLSWESSPGENIPAAAETTVRVLWDAESLYVSFDARDQRPANIRARYDERDGALDDDWVGVYIDPYNDDRRAYLFAANPLGVQRDALRSDVEGTEDVSWDGIWDSAGTITATGYIVEMAIPLQQVRTPSGSGSQTWGFLATRNYPRDVVRTFRSIVTDQNRDCLICQFQDVAGIERSSVGRQIEVTPSITAKSGETLGDDGGLEGTGSEVEFGVSGRWAMTPGTSLQATINPDFSQIEADAAQLDVNTRFALFFPERRPFFLEGLDFFETQIPLVFTRTIAEPEGGLKVTGKSGANAFGLLVAEDDVTNVLIPGDQSSRITSVPGGSTNVQARYRRDVGEAANLGGLLTWRSGENFESSVISFDSYLRFLTSNTLRVQIAGSRTDYPALIAGQQDRDIEGHAGYISYSHADRDWSWSASYGEYSPEFRADSGFVNQVGIRFADAEIQRRVRSDGQRWFSNLYFSVGGDAAREWDGEWTDWGADINFDYEGPRQSYFGINLAPNQESFGGETFRNFRQSVYGQMNLGRDVDAGVTVRWGETIDFANVRAADFVTVSPYLTFAAGRHVRGDLRYDFERLETQQGMPVFDVSLPQARLLWHLNARVFLRTILQYESVDRNPAAYDVPVREHEENLLGQFLFSYRLNAQTALLAGYSDVSESFVDRSLTTVDRTLFLKVSYAWLF